MCRDGRNWTHAVWVRVIGHLSLLLLLQISVSIYTKREVDNFMCRSIYWFLNFQIFWTDWSWGSCASYPLRRVCKILPPSRIGWHISTWPCNTKNQSYIFYTFRHREWQQKTKTNFLLYNHETICFLRWIPNDLLHSRYFRGLKLKILLQNNKPEVTYSFSCKVAWCSFEKQLQMKSHLMPNQWAAD